MIYDRILKPRPEDVFYHYCPVETFRLICETKSLRFSDINMMNDFAESAWGYGIFEEAANRLLSSEKSSALKDIDKQFFDDVDEIISPMQLFTHPIICSFSKDPDVLSQWRAYADDGRGVAIGFCGDALRTLPATLLVVEYDHQKQVSEMADTLTALYLAEEKRKHTRGQEFSEACHFLAMAKFAYKNPTFAEEREVRCLHALAVRANNEMPHLLDEGGVVEGKDSPGYPVKFRTRDAGLIAYVDIPLSMSSVEQPIKEVWLGPKNCNGPGNIIFMMSSYGLKDYVIKGSKASYR